MSLLTIRGYARHRQLSHVAVLKALRTGRIRRTEDGLIDSEQADRDWARNTHPAPRAPRAVPAPMTADAGFARARTVREHYQALLAKDEFERRSAELLDANEVKVVAYRIGQTLREHVFRIPDAVIARLRAHIGQHGAAPDEHAVHGILDTEIRGALEEFCDEMLAGLR